MTITITIPDNVSARVISDICEAYGYNYYLDTTADSPKLTKNQFAKGQLINFIKETMKNIEGAAAIKLAKGSSDSDIDSSINIT